MNKELIEFLSEEVPNSLSDIREVLDLLVVAIDDSIDKIGERVNDTYNKKDFDKSKELISHSMEIDAINKKIQDFISEIDNVMDLEEIKVEDDDRQIPNYSDFLVDSEIEHNLYEDLTHKRPCAFKIENNKIEVKDWKNTLVETVEYLGKKDKSKIVGFIGDPKMNGKKVTYFTKEKESYMRAPRYVKSADVYVETNLSANGTRNLLIKILKQFDIKLSDYKIYLKADYSDLH